MISTYEIKLSTGAHFSLAWLVVLAQMVSNWCQNRKNRRYTGLAPWAVYSAMQIGEWLKCIAGAVMVKKGVWLENLTGKGEDEKYLLRENEEKH